MTAATSGPQLRKWQQEALDSFLRDKPRDFMAVATPGAGKTTFTKGVAQGLGVEGYVNSPTFTLVNEYEGRLPVYHLDCYRLESGQEALDFGIEEYLYGDGVTIIEWPERIREIWPASYIRVSLSYVSETKRSLRLEPVGPEYVGLMQEFKKSAFGSFQ